MQLQQFQLHAELEERHWWFVARRRILHSLVREVVRPGRDATVIDVGCGTGANLAHLSGDYRCVGIDTSDEAIRLASARYPDLKWICGEAPAALGGELEQASLVVLSDVLEHVPDDFALLSSLLSKAAVGTYFLLTVPADTSLWSQHDESFGHYRRYDLLRFVELWQGLPVTTLMASYYNTRLYPLVKLIRSWNNRRGRSMGAEGTDFELPREPVNRMLTELFAAEQRRLLAQLRHHQPGFRRGVSLIALVRREAGNLPERSRPDWISQDHHCPATARLAPIGA